MRYNKYYRYIFKVPTKIGKAYQTITENLFRCLNTETGEWEILAKRADSMFWTLNETYTNFRSVSCEMDDDHYIFTFECGKELSHANMNMSFEDPTCARNDVAHYSFSPDSVENHCDVLPPREIWK
jgi:hypothetical protein